MKAVVDVQLLKKFINQFPLIYDIALYFQDDKIFIQEQDSGHCAMIMSSMKVLMSDNFCTKFKIADANDCLKVKGDIVIELKDKKLLIDNKTIKCELITDERKTPKNFEFDNMVSIDRKLLSSLKPIGNYIHITMNRNGLRIYSKDEEKSEEIYIPKGSFRSMKCAGESRSLYGNNLLVPLIKNLPGDIIQLEFKSGSDEAEKCAPMSIKYRDENIETNIFIAPRFCDEEHNDIKDIPPIDEKKFQSQTFDDDELF
ncbi:hypothetical protein [Sulfuricurvum sp.]|uniref:hypothetical protein n=1 Tax=Sulfuricurvum sp. TaxID=2025608 RepID=UPI003566C133